MESEKVILLSMASTLGDRFPRAADMPCPGKGYTNVARKGRF